MLDYEEQLLEKWSYGLERTYPLFYPNFKRVEVENIIRSKLQHLLDITDTDIINF